MYSQLNELSAFFTPMELHSFKKKICKCIKIRTLIIIIQHAYTGQNIIYIYNILFKKDIVYNIDLANSCRISPPPQFPVGNGRQCFTSRRRPHREKNKTRGENPMWLVLSFRSRLDECWRHSERDSDDKHFRRLTEYHYNKRGATRSGHRHRH